MKIRKDGIYKTIDSKDFGYWQKLGFEKVVERTLDENPIKKVKPEIVEEIVEEKPLKEVEEEVVIPKSKKRK